jgi:hypothetical protein
VLDLTGFSGIALKTSTSAFSFKISDLQKTLVVFGEM